jgi:hypothetical protein
VQPFFLKVSMRGRDRKDPFRARNIISPQTLPVKNEPRVFPIFHGFCAMKLSQTHRSVRQSVKSAGRYLKSAGQSLKNAGQSESEMPRFPAFVSQDPHLCAAAGEEHILGVSAEDSPILLPGEDFRFF